MLRSLAGTLRFMIIILSIYFNQISSSLAENNNLPIKFEESARLDMITPSGKYLRKGNVAIGVDFTFSPIPSESIEYLGFVTYNGTPYGPLTFVVTPGESTVKTKMRWYVKAAGEEASVRFRLIGIGNVTKIGYQFIDITKYYSIVKQKLPSRPCNCSK